MRKIFNIPDRLSGLSLNPIVVRELRQAVRSRFVTAAILLFLLVQIVGMSIGLVSRGIDTVISGEAFARGGSQMYMVFQGILTAACLLFVPLYTAVRLSAERAENNIDLLYITTISPSAIIRGKLIAGGVITLLLFSIAMPFMSFTYLLRGIDLPSIALILLMNYFAIFLVIQTAIFFACIPLSKTIKTLLALFSFGWIMSLLTALLATSDELLRSGLGSRLGSWSFWSPALLILGGGLTVFAVLHSLSVAMIMPSSANRALPVRICVTVAWLAWGLALVSMAFYEKQGEIIIAWLGPSLIFLCMAMLITSAESDRLSARVRREIPGNRLLRVVFLFYSGNAAGILWVLILAGLTIVLSPALILSIEGRVKPSTQENMSIFIGIFIYVYAYTMTSLLIWRIFLRNRCRQLYVPLIAALIVAICATLPWLAGFALDRISSQNPAALWHAGNVFALANDQTRQEDIMFALVWAIIITAFHVPWILRQIRNFRPQESNLNA